MGGKGRKRREKNYLAAHGGNRGLPPPPDPSSVNAIPSKLRMLMSLTGEKEISTRKKTGNGVRNSDKTLHLEDNKKHEFTSMLQLDNGGEDGKSVAEHPDSSDEPLQPSMSEKRKKKRKRNQVNDLRFNALPGAATSSKRKERRKQRLEEKKKKRKRNKEEEHVDFPTRDHVKFGDVVQAPPKLVAVPKALKNLQNASQERLRIQAVEAYRKRKGERPVFQLPSISNE